MPSIFRDNSRKEEGNKTEASSFYPRLMPPPTAVGEENPGKGRTEEKV